MTSEVIVETFIKAPIATCFDLARNIEIHTQTVWKKTKERAVGGRIAGCIELNDYVIFEAIHFGVKQQLTSQIISFERPFHFADEMQKGAFKTMKHTHEFKEINNGTLMIDILHFSSPFGLIGKAFNYFILDNYMRKFLIHRNQELKKMVEASISITNN